jgi:hypothetical protein
MDSKEENHLDWIEDFDEALKTSRAQGKPVYLDFFNPT